MVLTTGFQPPGCSAPADVGRSGGNCCDRAFFAGPWLLSMVRDALVMGILALSYDLLWGRAGVLTLGHTTFLGLGAYGFAVTTVQFGQAPLMGLAAGMFCAVAVAAVIGYFLLFAGVRLHFFAIISLAVLIVAQQLAVSWQSVTGGDTGILAIPGLSFGVGSHTFDLGGPSASWYTVAVFLLAATGLVWLVCRSRYGKVLDAIATNEWRAKACGYHTSFHLLLVFVASAVLAAIAGALMAACSGVVAPDVFSPLLATEVILWVAIGGRGRTVGPVVAAVVLTLLRQTVSSYSTDGWPLILGGLFLGCVLFMPNGLRLHGLVEAARRVARTPWSRPLVHRADHAQEER
ncbi:branched-chain amino acid ABC transporter permease [Burkholderia gladioli]|uniref:branched-chain amino acid ABC transporter permease n=1 Tax=Burkholderia gladioli TaxID=28095 RepID=UPI0039F45EB6